MTCRQAKECGAHVRKGERGNLVVCANTITTTEEQDDGSEEERTIPFLKGLFNVEQIEGLPEHFHAKPGPVIDLAERIEHAEAFFAASGADVRHGGNRAFYCGGSDHVQMPHFEAFHSPEACYATLAHELGAAFLCADLALTPEPGEDHAACIQGWLKVLKDDKRAADFLQGLQPVVEEEPRQAVA